MKIKEGLPELLCPAGDFDCLLAAVAAGADAVYIGGARFGARAYAKNFNIEEISRAVSYCHLHGVRLYVTVNTLVYDKEMRELLDYACELYAAGVDALIVADIGAIRAIRAALPDFELHASTQLSVHNLRGADEAAALGCSRVVLARELPLSEIELICREACPEIEVFLHGALCVSHSGQCLFSSLVGGRSGNRGECAQPCRLPYNDGKYPLSLKDLSLAEHIPSLIASGVASLKIEGRMKSPSYVYTVASVYRKLLDEGRAATASEMEILRAAFSRGGFTDGYFRARIDSGMTGVRGEDDKRASRENEALVPGVLRKSVRARVALRLGEPSQMEIYSEGRRAVSLGATPRAAESHPLTHTELRSRLSKMGNTYLSLAEEDIEIELDEGINLSPAEINSLRREAALAYQNFGRDMDRVPDFDKILNTSRKKAKPHSVTAEFYRGEEFLEIQKQGCCSDILSFVSLFSSDEALSAAGGIVLPPVIREGETEKVLIRLRRARELGVSRALIGNIGHISLCREEGLEIYGGFRLNITNSLSMGFWLDAGVCDPILSPELTIPQARDISGGIITYGRIPLMLTERCFIKENFGCSECGKSSLVDRKGELFPMMREFEHRNIILNSSVTYMGDRRGELFGNGLTHHHLIFTVESASEIERALAAHKRGEDVSQFLQIRRIGRRSFDKDVAAKRRDEKRSFGKNRVSSSRDKSPQNAQRAKKQKPKKR